MSGNLQKGGKVARKKSNSAPMSFECAGSKDKVFARMYRGLLTSNAFCDLTTRQKVLLVCMRADIYGVAKPTGYGDDTIYFNKARWDKAGGVYKLYTSGTDFARDKDALTSHGFIKQIYKPTFGSRDKAIYKFVEDWKNWKARPP